jgi:hypothetical protein
MTSKWLSAMKNLNNLYTWKVFHATEGE